MILPQINGAKQRFQALILGISLLLIVAYFFSFRNTINAFTLSSNNSQALEEASSAPMQIKQLRNQLALLEESLVQSNYNRQALFEAVNTFCESHELKLDYFHPEQRYIHDDYQIITNKVEVEGAYKNIVELIYYLEQEQKLGHIASTNFERKEERRTKRKYLTAEIYIQNIQTANLTSND